MFIVDHKFSKTDADMSKYQAEIVSLAQQKRVNEIVQSAGFMGVNLDMSYDKSSFTISIYWESREMRDKANETMTDIGSNNYLQTFCHQNEIVYTRESREID